MTKGNIIKLKKFIGGSKMQKEFLTVKELYRQKEEYIGKTVKVAGWIRTSRLSKNFGFIELNDGSFFKNMQIVLWNSIKCEVNHQNPINHQATL